MDVKEKLVELLSQIQSYGVKQGSHITHQEGKTNREIASHLIDNGATVQEWISFDEIKPKDGQSVLGITTEGEMEVYQFDVNWQTCLCQYGGNVKVFNITHWCELPQPPKGE